MKHYYQFPASAAQGVGFTIPQSVPALLALSENDTASIGQNMVIAFSGVTLALIAASISFVILNIRRRWLFEELRTIEKSDSFYEEDE